MEIKHRSELHKLLPKMPTVAEIGVAEGLFSREIVAWGVAKLWCVDLWETASFPGDASSPMEWHNKNYKEATERLSGFKEVEFLRGPSVPMAFYIADRSLDLVYIDACHSYECVKADIKAYRRKLKHTGVIAFHDFLNKDYGVGRAVREFAEWNDLKVNLIPENKEEDAGAWIEL
jgi:hypothetical protein